MGFLIDAVAACWALAFYMPLLILKNYLAEIILSALSGACCGFRACSIVVGGVDSQV
jgi:hypothetical protein